MLDLSSIIRIRRAIFAFFFLSLQITRQQEYLRALHPIRERNLGPTCLILCISIYYDIPCKILLYMIS